MMTAEGAHRTLRVLLRVLAILIVIGGFVAIFGTEWLIRSFLPSQGGGYTVFFLVAFKSLGALAFLIGYLLYAASRDPVRYVAVVEAVGITLLVLAAIDIYSIVVLHFAAYYPAAVLWGRVVVRIAVGIALLVLRPRAAAA